MKLLVTFALLALVSVVYCEKVWVDVKEKCPEGEGWAVKRFGGPVKSICVSESILCFWSIDRFFLFVIFCLIFVFVIRV